MQGINSTDFTSAILWASTVGYAVTLPIGHIVNKLRRI
jgi:hypothetical protein